MTTSLVDAERIRRLPWLVGGDAFNIMFVLLTFSGSVFVLFLDELEMNTSQIGFLLSLVPLCGVIAPLITPIVTRIGYKRVFVTARMVRIIPIALMMLTPLVLQRYDKTGTFLWVSSMILIFAVMRAISETGSFPWRKEIVPDAIRGKFSAITGITTTVASIIVALGAGFVIDTGQGLGRFMLLIACGVACGVISVLFFARMPSEDRTKVQLTNTRHWAGIREALTNRAFLLFLLILALATLGGRSIISSFIPLFMKEQVGLTQGVVVLLSIGTHIGALFSSYFWGWAADRYSSRPVMQVSLVLMLLLPPSWLLLPRRDPSSTALAMAIAFVAGIALLAWQVSWTRYLYVNAIPTHNRSAYLSFYFAWISLVAGMGPLLAGQLLTFSAGIRARQLGIVNIDAYTPLFVFSIALLAASMVLIPRLSTESDITFKRFAGMFLRGNPVRAMRSLIQYNQSGDEMTRVMATEQMGDTHTLLTSDELIEALNDPSYSVRHEAIHSIGRMPAAPELVTALVDVLQGSESELGMATARALGRLGDPSALPALRRSLHSKYDLIAAESARALGQLEDVESIPDLKKKMYAEPNLQLKVAYAAALGKLRATEVIPDLFQLLSEAKIEAVRVELGLAIARIVGDERYFLQQWRAFRSDFDTAAAQAVLAMQKPARRVGFGALDSVLEGCAKSFGARDVSGGVATLRQVLEEVAAVEDDETIKDTLQRCSQALAQGDDTRLELILLSLHVLDLAWNAELKALPSR
jgi:MFS family permease